MSTRTRTRTFAEKTAIANQILALEPGQRVALTQQLGVNCTETTYGAFEGVRYDNFVGDDCVVLRQSASSTQLVRCGDITVVNTNPVVMGMGA